MAHTELFRGALEIQVANQLCDIDRKSIDFSLLANRTKNKKLKQRYEDMAAACLLRSTDMKIRLLEMAILESKGN